MLPSLCAALEQGFQLGRLRSRRRNHPPSSCLCLPSSTQLLLTTHFPLDLIVNCLSCVAQRPIVPTSWPLVLSFESLVAMSPKKPFMLPNEMAYARWIHAAGGSRNNNACHSSINLDNDQPRRCSLISHSRA
jgi:hypothetical protein